MEQLCYIQRLFKVVPNTNICEIGCKVYYKALCAENLISGFNSTMIFPTNRKVISSLATKPSEIFVSANNPTTDETEPVIVNEIQSVVHVEETNDPTDLSVPEDFFESKVDKIKKRKSEKKVKPRQCVSKLTSGKPVTEDENFELIKNYEAEKINKSVKKDNKSTKGKGQGNNLKLNNQRILQRKVRKQRMMISIVFSCLKNLVHLMQQLVIPLERTQMINQKYRRKKNVASAGISLQTRSEIQSR